MFGSDNSVSRPIGLLIFLLQIARTKNAEGEVVEEWHALLPVEKKLILYSLIVAAILLVVLVWVSYTYFRVR